MQNFFLAGIEWKDFSKRYEIRNSAEQTVFFALEGI